ncbi:hypothetical protein [Hathewaya limosa]|uniref:YcxB-like protein domain-containing protein n=1 Tax=Hathewaya limosa TaxID=1536 RepID=A0ABU0JT64_HATLI|nr:hypothetical protein [Hathewaya limosa]MDQ0480292.1 hypothetical protein [Hathewaya limosa]
MYEFKIDIDSSRYLCKKVKLIKFKEIIRYIFAITLTVIVGTFIVTEYLNEYTFSSLKINELALILEESNKIIHVAYTNYIKWSCILGIVILGIIIMQLNKNFRKYVDLELNKKQVAYFIENTFHVDIKDQGLYIKDSIKDTIYYWNMIEGYYESDKYIYIADKLNNIIAVIPVNKKEIDKSELIDKLQQYTTKITKPNKKYKCIKKSLE